MCANRVHLLLVCFVGLAVAADFLGPVTPLTATVHELRAKRQTKCSALTCAKAGEPCSANVHCTGGYCNITDSNAVTGKCLKKGSEGDPCFENAHCRGGTESLFTRGSNQYLCSGENYCFKKRSTGSACANSAACETGVCDMALLQCVDPYTAKEGMICGNHVSNGHATLCLTGLYCHYLDGTAETGVCTVQQAAGADCTGLLQDSCKGECLDNKCVDLFTLPTGTSCGRTGSLCISGVCGNDNKCVDVSTPWDGSGQQCTNGDSSTCPNDAYCWCNWRSGSYNCYGVAPKVLDASRDLANCAHTNGKSPFDCLGKTYYLNHIYNTYYGDICDGASGLAVSVASVVLMLLALLF